VSVFAYIINRDVECATQVDVDVSIIVRESIDAFTPMSKQLPKQLANPADEAKEPKTLSVNIEGTAKTQWAAAATPIPLSQEKELAAACWDTIPQYTA